jgi:glycerol kinase
MLSAGTNVEWLSDDLQLIDDPADSHAVASRCDDSGGVVYVPALMGLGTPRWDYGARGALLGLTRGSGREQVVRAVLEGVAHRGADLLEAAHDDTGLDIHTVRVDGGMIANPTFVQALADAADLPIEVAPVAESTTMGAAFMAGLGVGIWDDIHELDDLWAPARVVEPSLGNDHAARRARWRDAVDRAAGWYPDLSALDF